MSGNRVTTVPAGSNKATAFVIEVTGDAETAWKELRERLERSGRWPVLTLLQSFDCSSWDAQVRSTDVFSRFYFEEERREGRENDSPEAIVEASRSIDGGRAVAEFPEDDSVTLDDCVSICEEGTEVRFGKVPEIGDSETFLAKHHLKSQKAIERWFLEWELANCDNPLELDQFGLGHLKWYEPTQEKTALVLLPTSRGWEALAYINWFASQGRNSQVLVALLREWSEKYGAELVAHYGTMLQFVVRNPPGSVEEAFEVAWQHHTVAQCTTILPGVSPRDHARALLQTDRWFLHERP